MSSYFESLVTVTNSLTLEPAAFNSNEDENEDEDEDEVTRD